MIGRDRLRKLWRGKMFGTSSMRWISRAGSHVCPPSVVRVNISGLLPVSSRKPVSVSSQTA